MMMFTEFVGMTLTTLIETLTVLEEEFEVVTEDGTALWVLLEEGEFIIDEDTVSSFVQED